MRTLYHYQHSPYSRRVRLALAHKGLDVELRDGRQRPEWVEEARRLVSVRTLPVFVDEGRPLADSSAICHWLDHAYPRAPRLWLDEDAHVAFEVAALVDVALGGAVDLGTRYYPLRNDPAWGAVKGEVLGRAQRALEGLGTRIATLDRSTISPGGWSAADMWLVTAVFWFEGLPGRAATNPNIAQVLSLGLQTPPALTHWADAYRDRPDVRALD